MDLWDVLNPGHNPLIFWEDNEAMIRVCRSGRNPTMKTLNRTHAVSIAAMKEVFDREDIELRYVPSARQAADIYTKAFDNGDKWKEVCILIGVYDMKTFDVQENITFWATPPPSKATLAQENEVAAPADCGRETPALGWCSRRGALGVGVRRPRSLRSSRSRRGRVLIPSGTRTGGFSHTSGEFSHTSGGFSRVCPGGFRGGFRALAFIRSDC